MSVFILPSNQGELWQLVFLDATPQPACLTLFHGQRAHSTPSHTTPHTVQGLSPVCHQPRLCRLCILPLTTLWTSVNTSRACSEM